MYRSQRPFSTSVMIMTKVLSAVTGDRPTTIQPLLNRLLSKDVANKNNPLISFKTVNIIENKLLSIGFECKVK
jgi:hypothetical protein